MKICCEVSNLGLCSVSCEKDNGFSGQDVMHNVKISDYMFVSFYNQFHCVLFQVFMLFIAIYMEES